MDRVRQKNLGEEQLSQEEVHKKLIEEIVQLLKVADIRQLHRIYYLLKGFLHQ